MAHAPALLDKLEKLPLADWRGTAYRYVPEGRPPEKPNTLGARWNPRNVDALYTTLEVETARAELEFHLAALSPRPSNARFTLYKFRLEAKSVLDLRPSSVRSSLGLSQPALEADDALVCRSIGGACAWLKIGALLVPSARRVTGNNLVIFVANQSVDFEPEILESVDFP